MTKGTPLSISLGMILKRQKDHYRETIGITSREASDSIAKDCAISSSMLGGLEAGTHVASQNVASRIALSEFYKFDYSNFLLFVGLAQAVGLNLRGNEDYKSKVDQIIPRIGRDDLREVLEQSKSIDITKSSAGIKYQIHDTGLYNQLGVFLSGENHQHLSSGRRTKYFADFATKDDLHYIKKTRAERINAINPNAANLDYEFFHTRYLINDRIATIIYRDSSKAEKMGYFVIYPINKKGVDNLFNSDQKRVTPDVITSTFEECCGIWMGIIVGGNDYASGIIISEMIEHIKPLLFLPNLRHLFTAPGSSEGLRLMERFGFEKIKGSRVYTLTITESRLQQFGIERILNFR